MLVFLSIVLVVIFVLILLVLLFFSFLTIDLFLDLPFVGTKKEKIATILKLANIKKGETVVDLGSGDGRLLFAAAQKGAKAIGYELNPFLVWFTRIKAHFLLLRARRSNPLTRHSGERSDSRIDSGQARMTGKIIVKQQNFWKADLAKADVIFVYSFRKTMQKFEDFVYRNAKKGTRIVVNTNPFPNKKPQKSQNGIFLYKI